MRQSPEEKPIRVDLEPYLPIYESIKRTLRSQIERAELVPGDALPSENALAAKLSVSRGQTRQALRDLEMEGYVVRSPGRGTFVAPAESWAATAARDVLPTFLVALPIGDRPSYYTRLLVEGIVSRAAQHAVHPTFYYLSIDCDHDLRFLSELSGGGSQGLLIWPFDHRDEAADRIRKLVEDGFPVVVFDQFLQGVDIDFVGTDNREIYRRLTSELLERGHTEVGHLRWRLWDPVTEDRLEGQRETMEEAGLALPPERVIRLDDPWQEDRFEVMDAFFAAQPDVTAMVCGQDWLSEILVTYFDERGIDVPGDIELAVLDDNLTPTHRVLPRCLSAVQDGRAVGEEACELLLRRIREADAPLRQTLVPARFVGYGIRKAGSRLMTRPRGKEAN